MSRLGICFFFAISFQALCKISFEPNKGQTDPQVRYLARTSTGVIFATAQEIILHREKSGQPINISFENANLQAQWQPLNPTGHKIHYLVGRDPSKHINGLDSFQKLTRKNLYPGIDLVLYGNDKNQLEYDLIVAPSADPSRIRIKAPGARIIPKPATSSSGTRRASTNRSFFRTTKPSTAVSNKSARIRTDSKSPPTTNPNPSP